MAETSCPTCGASVRVVTDGEGTSFYRPHSDVWAMVFPGMNVLWSPLLKLALIRLREGVADDDPLRLTAAGVLARDLPCGRAAASKLVETLHGLGWVDEQGWPTREET